MIALVRHVDGPSIGASICPFLDGRNRDDGTKKIRMRSLAGFLLSILYLTLHIYVSMYVYKLDYASTCLIAHVT